MTETRTITHAQQLPEYAKVTVVIETSTRRITFELPKVYKSEIEAKYYEPHELALLGIRRSPELESVLFTFDPLKNEDGISMLTKHEDLTVEAHGD